MSANKEMKFIVGLDSASVSQFSSGVNKLISDLTRLIDTAAKASAALGGGFGVSGKGGVNSQQGAQAAAISKVPDISKPLVQGLANQAQALSGLTQGSKDTLKGMSDSVKESVSLQIRELNTLKSAIEGVQNAYKSYRAETGLPQLPASTQGGGGGGGGQRKSPWGPTEDGEFVEVGEQRKHPRGQRLLTAGGGPGYGGSGEGQGGGDDVGGDWWSKKRSLGSVGRMGGLVLAGVSAVAHEVMAETRSFSSIGAQRAQSGSAMYGRLLSGDVRELIANKSLDPDQQKDMANQVTGAGQWMESAVDVTTGTIANGAKLIIGGKNSPGDPAKSIELNKGRNVIQMSQDNAAAKGATWNAALDSYYGSIDARIQAQRIIGTGGIMAGARTGHTGASSVSGGPLSGAQLEHALKTASYNAGDFESFEAKLKAQGYNSGMLLSSVASMRQAGGAKFGNSGAAYSDMAANAEGLAGYGQMMAMASRRGGVNLGDTFARMAIGGGIDRYAGAQFGAAVAGQGFDIMGTTSGQGTLEAGLRGMGFNGGQGDMNLAQRASAGLAFGSQMSMGSMDPYQRGQNLMTAMQINPKGDIYSQDFLANGMNFQQQLDMANDACRSCHCNHGGGTGGCTCKDAKGKRLAPHKYNPSPLTENMKNLVEGTDPEKRRMAKEQMLTGLDKRLALWTDAGGNSKSSMAMRAFRGSGKEHVTDWINTLGTQEEKQAALSAVSSALGRVTGGKEEEVLGYTSLIAGSTGTKALGLGGVGTKIKGPEGATIEGQAKAQEERAKILAGLSDEITKESKNIPTALATINTWTSRMDAAADDFVTNLGFAADALKAFATNQKIVHERPKKGALGDPGSGQVEKPGTRNILGNGRAKQ